MSLVDLRRQIGVPRRMEVSLPSNVLSKHNPSKPEYDSAAVHQFLGGVERVIDGLSTRATEALQGGPQDYVGDSTRSASD